MAKQGSTQSIRYTFLVANGLFWAFSTALICYACYVAVENAGSFGSLAILQITLYFAFICGAGIFVTGLVGCCTGVRLNRNCVSGYLVLCVIFLVFGVITIILAAVWATQLSLLAWNNLSTEDQAAVQTEFGCCGYEDPISESENITLILDLSCYNQTDISANVTIYEPYTQGCKSYLSKTAGVSTLVIIGLVACIICSEILGIATGIVIIKRIRPKQSEEERVLHEGFEEKPRHKYREVSGPTNIDGHVYKD